ncbi:MAG: hypothetical protein AB7U82_12695, partial [Blastocatellales bacterium]
MSAFAQISGRLGQDPVLNYCDLKHNFAAPARLCFKNCAATLCFQPLSPDFNEDLPDSAPHI